MLDEPFAEGRFGYMFKGQPPHGASEDLLTALGQTMEEKPVIGTNLTDPETGEPVLSSDGSPVVATKDHNDALGENPNPLLTSGFTFVGQFIDHDITFDTTTLSEQQADPKATTNFRTPRYDLDAVYGRGPSKDPQFYDPKDRDKFLIVKRPYSEIRGIPTTSDVVYDVPRDANGKAIIADPRNDQTLILVQLHVALQLFHNKLVDHVRSGLVSTLFPGLSVFEKARRLARWHYQWMVTHDFLPAIVGKAMADSVYKEVLTGVPIINLKHYRTVNVLGRPYIPVEWSVAAYRFGHSIARPRYTVRDFVDTRTGATVAVSSVPLFEASPTDNNLNGGRPIPARLKMQWSKFFNAAGKPLTARPVRQFDANLSDALFRLPSDCPPRQQSHQPAIGAQSAPGPEDAPAFRTADRAGDGCDPADRRGAVHESPHRGARSHRWERGGSAARVRRGEPGSEDALRGSGLGRRGSAVVLHPQGGRDRRPWASDGARRRADRG